MGWLKNISPSSRKKKNGVKENPGLKENLI